MNYIEGEHEELEDYYTSRIAAEEEETEDDDEEEEEDEEEWDGLRTEGPVVALCIGLAGSGKSTLFHRLHYEALEASDPPKRCYFINLDPATREVPIEANIDIRDTVDYKGVMREYRLGPNGAIVTSLNLFATQFGQVIKILEKRASEFDYVIIDTPGQIEAFTWSASGQMIADSLASTFATTIIYVVDSPKSQSPATFMSNMVNACSILHKYELPLLTVFNKSDVIDPTESCFQWMDDFEAFHQALDEEERSGQSYITSLHRSMSLVLDEFYRILNRCAVSAATGKGIDDLWQKLSDSKLLYDKSYGNALRKRISKARSEQTEQIKSNMARLRLDMNSTTDADPDFTQAQGGNSTLHDSYQQQFSMPRAAQSTRAAPPRVASTSSTAYNNSAATNTLPPPPSS
uniref:GPN-loop GTPase n=1 Tax=Aureoumbra lagunensis TaxID=44058 RepID=A0A7S3K331_9STRA